MACLNIVYVKFLFPAVYYTPSRKGEVIWSDESDGKAVQSEMFLSVFETFIRLMVEEC